MPTHQQLYELYYQGDEATIRYIEGLQSHIDNQAQLLGHQQQMTINLLSDKIKRLLAQLKRVKDKLSRQQCITYQLTRRVQQLQSAIQQLEAGQVESQATSSPVRASGYTTCQYRLRPRTARPPTPVGHRVR